jgi:hypothetical protein
MSKGPLFFVVVEEDPIVEMSRLIYMAWKLKWLVTREWEMNERSIATFFCTNKIITRKL